MTRSAIRDPAQIARAVQGRAAARCPGILVLDDQEFVRSLLSTGLRGSGFTVWLAASGREAIKLYREHRADIDLVLLDVQMPDLDGPETLAALRAFDPQVKCCFLTGDMGSYSERQLFRLGARRVFSKPVRLNSLLRSLKRLAGPGDTGTERHRS
jgi:CheY-like chemotaxis protein